GNDALYGFAGNDVIYGGDGNESANESISAGSGIAADGRSNTITSPGGLYGGAGDDYLDGGRGDDYLVGDDEINPAIVGNDTLYGGSGLNTLIGGQGDDVIYSGGLDSAAGGPGNDIIWGVTDVGGSTYYGGSGNDIMASWKSSTFFGEAGNDTIFGSQESDSIYGGPGTDALAGYAGTDYLSGGGDRDLFNMWFDVRAGDVDFITDWNEGGGASDMLGLNTVFNGSVQYTQGTGFVDVALPIGAGFYHIYVLGSGVTAANVQANTYFVSV
ncbi:MAG: calcium-binding protein, partial [Hyphomicrobiaceae bacterium]